MALDTGNFEADDKENVETVRKPQKLSKATNSYQSNRPNSSSQHDETVKLGREPPTTPGASRLALSDLVGMKDIKSEEKKISPDERILWHHDASAMHSSDSTYGALRRVQKRARSSSPTSSPVHTAKRPSVKGEAFDLQRLNQCLKTPQTDPSADLWGRYNLSGNKGTPMTPQLPALAHIMYASSPQGSKEVVPKSEETLRKSLVRSSTCGTEWPKRRKVAVSEHQLQGDDVFLESFNSGTSKLSRVSVLLDKVQEGYTGRGIMKVSPGPSSSSPIPLGKVFTKVEAGSPLQQFERRAAKSALINQPELLPRVSGPFNLPKLHVENTVDNSGSNSSDYGDFDDGVFDVSMVDARTGDNPRPQIVATVPAIDPLEQPQQHVIRPLLQEEEDDEFGDLEDDVCAADLEEIVAKYDADRPESLLVVAPGVETVSGVHKGGAAAADTTTESEDEYGDDLDDIDFEAAEASATQSLQQHESSNTPLVRTSFS